MLQELRIQVLEANLELVRQGLVLYTFGNASGIARAEGLVAIKPSGVPYETLTAEDIVLVDLDGTVVEGEHRPSTDTPTHLQLYRSCEWIGGIVHTHSTWATRESSTAPAPRARSMCALTRIGSGKSASQRARSSSGTP